MILFDLMVDLKEALEAKGVPFPLVYGPEKTRSTTVGNRSRIVMMRDDRSGDGVDGLRDHHTNPRMYGVTAIGGIVRIFARSERQGADRWDHEGVCDQIRMHVRVCLDKIIRSNDGVWRVTGAKLLTAEELELRQITTWPGVVYELTFSLDAGEFDTDWAGEAALEVEVGGGPDGVGFNKSTTVKINGSDTEAPACGDP